LLAIGLSSVVSLILAELILRIFFPIPYNQYLPCVADGRIRGRGEPNQVVRNRDGYEVHINSLGFRGPEWQRQPAAGTLRLEVFGGSAALCFLAHGEENTWPSKLQSYLASRLAMPVEVVNLGFEGYDLTYSKINYLFLGRDLNPHAIVVYHTWNDMKRFRDLDAGSRDVFSPISMNEPLWRQVARKSQLCQRLRNLGWDRRRDYVENKFTTMESDSSAANTAVGEAAWHWYRGNFRDIARFAKSDGVLPVLVSQATLAQPANLEKKDCRRKIAVDYVGMTMPVLCDTWQKANREIRQVASEESAVFVDGYGSVPPDLEHLLDHVHLTDRGCDVLAEAIARQLVRDKAFQTLVAKIKRSAPAKN
jgi:hypothetical protein